MHHGNWASHLPNSLQQGFNGPPWSTARAVVPGWRVGCTSPVSFRKWPVGSLGCPTPNRLATWLTRPSMPSSKAMVKHYCNHGRQQRSTPREPSRRCLTSILGLERLLQCLGRHAEHGGSNLLTPFSQLFHYRPQGILDLTNGVVALLGDQRSGICKFESELVVMG